MEAKPLITVIVPVYNVEPYLRQCIDSILGQTYPHLEIILINDGSTDASGAICDEYARLDARIRLIHQENGGQSRARNVALGMATGDFISFVDSDDWVEPTMYEELVAVLGQYPDLDLLKFRFIKKSRPHKSAGRFAVKLYDRLGALNANKQGKLRTMACDALFRRQTLGYLRFAEGYYCEDVDYNLRAFAHKGIKVGLYEGRLYHYRTDNPKSTTSTKGLKLFCDHLDLWQGLLAEKAQTDAELYPYLAASFVATIIAAEGDIIKGLDRGRWTEEDAEYRRAKLKVTWQKFKSQLNDNLMPYLGFGDKFYLRYPRLYHALRHPIRFIKYHKFLINNTDK